MSVFMAINDKNDKSHPLYATAAVWEFYIHMHTLTHNRKFYHIFLFAEIQRPTSVNTFVLLHKKLGFIV